MTNSKPHYGISSLIGTGPHFHNHESWIIIKIQDDKNVVAENWHSYDSYEWMKRQTTIQIHKSAQT